MCGEHRVGLRRHLPWDHGGLRGTLHIQGQLRSCDASQGAKLGGRDRGLPWDCFGGPLGGVGAGKEPDCEVGREASCPRFPLAPAGSLVLEENQAEPRDQVSE